MLVAATTVASIPRQVEIGPTATEHPLLLPPPSPRVHWQFTSARRPATCYLGRRRTRKPGRVDAHVSKSQDSLVFRPTEFV